MLCGLIADDRAPHLTSLLPVAVRGLQPARPPQQRSAVALLSFMMLSCNTKEQESMQAAGFVSAAIHWLPSFRSNPARVCVLQATSELAQPHQLAPLMAAVLPDFMAEGKTLESAALLLLRIAQSASHSLLELFGSGEAAAVVATRLVQLLAHPSDEILEAAWLTCLNLWRRDTNRQLLLDAGLLQPTLFEQSMASNQTGIRTDTVRVALLASVRSPTARREC